MPLNPNAVGAGAKADDPSTWGTRRAAQRLAQRRKGGVGVELSALPSLPGWRLCGVDLDGCLDASSEAAPWAAAVLNRFDSYAEVSPSGTGLQDFCETGVGWSLRLDVRRHKITGEFRFVASLWRRESALGNGSPMQEGEEPQSAHVIVLDSLLVQIAASTIYRKRAN